MSCRCVFDFAAISREDTRRTLRRRRPRRLAPELPLLRAPPRAPRRRWTRCFLASSRKTRGSVVFRFSQVLPRWRFVSCELGRALCRAPVSTQCGALESPGARPRGEASLVTPPHRHARSRAVPGPGCDARAARPTAPTPLSRRPSRRLVHDRGKELVFPMTVMMTVSESDSTNAADAKRT